MSDVEFYFHPWKSTHHRSDRIVTTVELIVLGELSSNGRLVTFYSLWHQLCDAQRTTQGEWMSECQCRCKLWRRTCFMLRGCSRMSFSAPFPFPWGGLCMKMPFQTARTTLTLQTRCRKEWETRVQQLPAIFVLQHTTHTCWLPKRHICHLMWNNTKNRAPLWTDNTAYVWKQHLSLVVRKADTQILRLRLLFPLVTHWQIMHNILWA